MPDTSATPAPAQVQGVPRLELSGIGKRFGKTTAVDGISLAIEQGEIVCLLGPSGCGKSTTLRIAAGAERPDSGTVTIAGTRVAGPGIFVPPEHRSVGLVFQDYALFPHLTAAGNVAFGLHRHSRAEQAKRVADRLERLRISHLAKAYPHELSGGEQQRVALARALAPEPQLMLMDEPFSGLDRELRGHVREETVRVLKELGTATLIVTHDPEEALEIADRVAILRNGRLIQDAAPEIIWRKPADAGVARFIGEINTIAGMALGGTIATPWGNVSAALPDGPAQLLVRPEDLRVSDTGPELAITSSKFMGTTYLLAGTLVSPGFAPVEVSARVSLPAHPAPGSLIRLGCDMGSILVFSAES